MESSSGRLNAVPSSGTLIFTNRDVANYIARNFYTENGSPRRPPRCRRQFIAEDYHIWVQSREQLVAAIEVPGFNFPHEEDGFQTVNEFLKQVGEGKSPRRGLRMLFLKGLKVKFIEGILSSIM